MKSYDVMVETSDWITVDAETESDAESQAINIARCDLTHDWKATVMHERDLEE